MKIGPTPPPPGWPRGLPDRSPARADGFTELGMFGLSGAQSSPKAPAERRVRAVPQPQPSEQAEVAVPASEPRLADPLPCRIPVVTPVKERRTDMPAPKGPTITLVPVGDGLAPDPIYPRPPEADGGAGPEAPVAEAGAPAMPTRQGPPAPAPTVNLILRETAAGAEVVAAAPATDPQSRLALRRLIETMLARTGLTLAQFQLNGAPVAPDFLGKTGESHGSRSH